MHNPTLIKTFIAEGDISKDRFIVLSENGGVSQAGGSGAYILGATDRLPASHGYRTDVILQGIAEVEAGTNINAPAAVTANQHGQAVPAGSGDQVAGLAITSAAAGEVVSVLLGARALVAQNDNAEQQNGGAQQNNNDQQNGGDQQNNNDQQNGDDQQNNNDQQNDGPQAISVSDETVTYSTDASAFVLAHYPVVADSLVVKSADGETTYVFNTDYTVTLATGTITSVERTSMTFAENATIKASYQYTASA